MPIQSKDDFRSPEAGIKCVCKLPNVHAKTQTQVLCAAASTLNGGQLRALYIIIRILRSYLWRWLSLSTFHLWHWLSQSTFHLWCWLSLSTFHVWCWLSLSTFHLWHWLSLSTFYFLFAQGSDLFTNILFRKAHFLLNKRLLPWHKPYTLVARFPRLTTPSRYDAFCLWSQTMDSFTRVYAIILGGLSQNCFVLRVLLVLSCYERLPASASLTLWGAVFSLTGMFLLPAPHSACIIDLLKQGGCQGYFRHLLLATFSLGLWSQTKAQFPLLHHQDTSELTQFNIILPLLFTYLPCFCFRSKRRWSHLYTQLWWRKKSVKADLGFIPPFSLIVVLLYKPGPAYLTVNIFQKLDLF